MSYDGQGTALYSHDVEWAWVLVFGANVRGTPACSPLPLLPVTHALRWLLPAAARSNDLLSLVSEPGTGHPRAMEMNQLAEQISAVSETAGQLRRASNKNNLPSFPSIERVRPTAALPTNKLDKPISIQLRNYS